MYLCSQNNRYNNIMDIYSYTDNAILQQIGAKLKEERIAQNISQMALAEASGLSQFSVSQIENGHNTSLLSILAILRVLNRLEVLDELFAEKPISPVALSALMKSQKKRKRSYPKVTDEKITTMAAESDFNWDE